MRLSGVIKNENLSVNITREILKDAIQTWNDYKP